MKETLFHMHDTIRIMPANACFFDVFRFSIPLSSDYNQFSFTSNSLSQIVTSNSRSQPDTHFAVDMFPYRKPSFFRSLVSNPNFRKSPEICRFLALDFISLTSRLPSQRALRHHYGYQQYAKTYLPVALSVACL